LVKLNLVSSKCFSNSKNFANFWISSVGKFIFFFLRYFDLIR
jgi:hypothetical protein